MGTTFLPNFRLRFHKFSKIDKSGKCNIVAGNSGVYLAVFELSDSDREHLDRHEGLGDGYNHKEIFLPEFGICSTYIADTGSIDESLRPLDWYREYVLQGARFHRFPDRYISALEDVKVTPDTDNARAKREWNLIENLGLGSY